MQLRVNTKYIYVQQLIVNNVYYQGRKVVCVSKCFYTNCFHTSFCNDPLVCALVHQNATEVRYTGVNMFLLSDCNKLIFLAE